ncbi:hypothetical protein EYF80_050821 [Liparis tanakae]|uniref:Uncharacterized protein n=1 Tax=Liparis tanakae TaxID=230148 RepID=A0A4Z2FE18_9TELE|nr:hypothetical protein EYF80_050821 [Liparis tanakae]
MSMASLNGRPRMISGALRTGKEKHTGGMRGNSHQDNTLATVSRGTITIQYKETFADNEARRLWRGGQTQKGERRKEKGVCLEAIAEGKSEVFHDRTNPDNYNAYRHREANM